MKKSLLLCALVGAFFVGQAAHADTFSLSFAGCLGLGCVAPLGTTVTNGTSSPGVTDIFFTTSAAPASGTTPITGITGTVIIGGHIYDIDNLDTGLGGSNDNQLFDLGGFLSPDKLDFDLTAVGNPNPDYTELMLNFNSLTGAYDLSFQCGRKECTTSGDSSGLEIYDIDPGTTAAPEPGSLALLGTSILGGAGLLRRRLRA